MAYIDTDEIQRQTLAVTEFKDNTDPRPVIQTNFTSVNVSQGERSVILLTMNGGEAILQCHIPEDYQQVHY